MNYKAIFLDEYLNELGNTMAWLYCCCDNNRPNLQRANKPNSPCLNGLSIMRVTAGMRANTPCVKAGANT